MVRAVDQEAIERAMDQRSIGERATDAASDGSKSNRRSDGWSERWIREL